MGYKPKLLEELAKRYERGLLANYQVIKIERTAKSMGPRYQIIVSLALQNKSTQEMAAAGIIKSESDRNRGQSISAASIRKAFTELSRRVGFSVRAKDLNLYAQRKALSIYDAWREP